MSTTARPTQDHVDQRLEELCGDLPDLDLDVEGIVERIQGIDRRLRLVMEDTLDDHGLSYGEWKLLCKLRRAPERTSTPGELSASLELSSGAMTNRIDGLERDGLVRRHPDPRDRRGVRVEMTGAGEQAWIESTNAQAIKESTHRERAHQARAASAERAAPQADARARARRAR